MLNGSRLITSSWSGYFGLYFTWSVNQSIGGNYSDITVNTYGWLGKYGYLDIGSRGDNYNNIAGSAIGVYTPAVSKYYSSEATILLNSRTQRVYHNSDGTLPNVFIRFVWYIRAYIDGVYRDNIDCSFYTGAIKTIPRASKITSDASVTIPNDLKINIQSFYGAFTHNITLKVGGNVVRTLTGVKGNQTINFTDSEIQSFYNETSKKYLDSEVTVVTKNGNTTIGTSVKKGKFYFNESLNKPIFEQFTFEPIDNGTKELTSWTSPISVDNGLSIKNKTKYKITCGNVTFKNNATLSYYLVELNGKSYKSTTSTIELDIPISYADYLKVSVVDSRGFVTTVSKQITVMDYFEPTPQEGFEISRQKYPNNESVKITGTIKFTKTEKIANTINIYIKYKETDSETWSTKTPITFEQSGDTVTIDYTKTGFELDKLYDFELIANDYYGKDVIVETLIFKDVPDIFLKPHDIEIDGESIKGEINNIVVTRNSRQNITGKSSVPIQFNEIKSQKGDKLSLNSDGGIEVGANVEYVRVGSIVWMEAYSGYSLINICKKTGNNNTWHGQHILPAKSTEVWRSHTLETIIPVKEGDIIYTYAGFSTANSNNNVAGSYANAVLMNVEAISGITVVKEVTSSVSAQKNILSTTLTGNLTPTKSTYYEINTFKQAYKIGDKLSIENGKIKIGEGVNHIKITGNLGLYSPGAGLVYIWTKKNGENIGAWQVQTIPTSYWQFNIEQLFDVEEGDVVSISLYNEIGVTIENNKTLLNFEAID